MKERISALMDGELEDQAAGAAIDELARDPAARETWRLYHLISDALRENQPLARAAVVPIPQPRRWTPLPIAASLAAVALVGWVAFSPQPPAPLPQPVVAQAPAPKAAAAPVPLPSAARDYMLAHQGVSPRGSLQGMAPYVRTVSDDATGTRR
jgi:sigma-E factor negative regulatory protein RseA